MSKKKKKKRGRKFQGPRQACSLRLPVDLMAAADKEAKACGLSRNQFIERCVRYAVLASMEMRDDSDTGSLFMNAIRDDVEDMLKQALRDAMREGGMDRALFRADVLRKKKGGKKRVSASKT